MKTKLLILAVVALGSIHDAGVSQGQTRGQPQSSAEACRNSTGVHLSAWQGMIEDDWLRQAGTQDDPLTLRAATKQALQLARATLSFVQLQKACPTLTGELAKLEGDVALADSAADWKGLYLQTRWLRRRIIFAHPLLGFDRLLINKCPPPMRSHMCDECLGRWSVAGPGLCVLDHWTENPQVTPLLQGKLPVGSTSHPDLSFDAKRVIFGFCDHTVPELAGPEAEPEFLLGAIGAFSFPGLTAPPPFTRRLPPAPLTDHVRKAARRQFFIYEADLDGSHVRQLTGTSSDPMSGWEGRQTALIEDIDPCYLPGGGFAFVSTRCQSFGRCHTGRYAPSFVLYRAEANGANIRRISPGELNEWEPSVLPDGRLLFARWDYVDRENNATAGLWACRPDGTELVHYYKNYSRAPNMTSEALPIPGSHQVVCTATGHHSFTSGSIITLDPRLGQDGLRPVRRITPEVKFQETEEDRTYVRDIALRGRSFMEPTFVPPASAGTEAGSAGNYASPYPLGEDLFLAAWSSDRPRYLVRARVNAYGIYLIDTLGGRELVYRDPDASCFSPIPIRPRPVPPVSPSGVDLNKKEGTFVVQDVYRASSDIQSQIKPGSIRRLRVIRIDPQPAAGRAYSGPDWEGVVKGIVGTVPVGPDGSVAFRAPADVPLMFQLLDENGMAVMTMRSQTHVRPSETIGCVGCHEPRDTTPGAVAARSAVRSLDPPAGPHYPGGFSFARTVQPVLDRYCIRCHGLEKKEGGVDLVGTPTSRVNTGYTLGFTVAFESLLRRPELPPIVGHEVIGRELRKAIWTREGVPSQQTAHFPAAPPAVQWVSLVLPGSQTMASKPRDYYAHAGRLAGFLLSEHREHVVLDRESFERIAQWLDLNAQYYGDYSWNRPERRSPSAEGERSLRQHVRAQCGSCHVTLADQPLAALINIALPQESRLLRAPLSREAGGWGLCRETAWPDTGSKQYQDMLRTVLSTVGSPERTDIAGTCGLHPCICGSCWVRLLAEKETDRTAVQRQ